VNSERDAGMRKIFYVDLAMCGGDALPEDFDLEDFCEVLQGKVGGEVEVVPVEVPAGDALNLDPHLVSPGVFHEALGEYCHR